MMKTSVQTVRLPSTPVPNPKRLSRTCSSLSASLHRLSCAPEDSSVLSLALSPRPTPPSSSGSVFNLHTSGSHHRKMPPPPAATTADDHLYEEISSTFPLLTGNNANGNNHHNQNQRARVVPGTTPLPPTQLSSSSSTQSVIPVVGAAADPPKLAPVSGVLHNKDAIVIRPIAFKPYIRSPMPSTPTTASLTSPTPAAALKAPLSHTCSATCSQHHHASLPDNHHRVVPTTMAGERYDRKPTGRSLSDPWKGAGSAGGAVYRKQQQQLNGDYTKSRSTPSSMREDSTGTGGGQMVYYPSSSDKSSYGYVSCSDQSAESLYGVHQTYHARMIRPEDDTDYSFDPYQINSTPSPSDSGIAVNYEALLRDKDLEIQTLRTTMERNEGVIFKVHEEKEAQWKRQTDALKHHYEQQLQKQSSDHLARQNELTRNVDLLRQQNIKLQQQLQSSLESQSNLEDNLQDLQTKYHTAETNLAEANWNVTDKTSQISMLKRLRSGSNNSDAAAEDLPGKLEAAQKEAIQRGAELKDLRQTLNFLSQELFQVQQKFDSAREELEQRRETATGNRSKRASFLLCGSSAEFSVLGENSSEAERLRKELTEVRGRYAAEKRSMEEERAAWFEEKEKVIKYQKQLQLNYLEIYKRNCQFGDGVG
ncbi:hypothetical protein BV898_00292 [Hypsibius exemplaris]|uniref:Leucine zipper tumor suppressor 2 n=1 Tax=Hypsibius exemplaris TaxID=2072580 RepID=A0A1W0XFN3_HYPEX|nr:hypothetical protein BV898_00292 [Hypsibius exemplaris]